MDQTAGAVRPEKAACPISAACSGVVTLFAALTFLAPNGFLRCFPAGDIAFGRSSIFIPHQGAQEHGAMAEAGMYYFVVIALKNLPQSPLISSGIVAVSTCSNMLGNLFFMKTTGRIRSGKMILCANGICAACMMIVPLGLNTAAFFAVYLIYGIANIISQAAVPVGVLQSTPTRDLPFISSARMFACSGATCIMIPIFGTWIERSGAGGVMLVAALLFVAAGICFNRQYRDEIKDE